MSTSTASPTPIQTTTPNDSSVSHSSSLPKETPKQPSKIPSKPSDPLQEAKDVVITFLRSFFLGTGGKTLLNLLGLIFNKRKRNLKYVLKSIDTDFGLFLGSYSSSQKALFYLFRRFLGPKYIESASLLSGAISGLSLSFIKDPLERVTYALYMLVRGVEGTLMVAASKGVFPKAITDFEHMDTLLMSLTAGQILFAYVCEPDTLSPTYLHFLRNMGIDQEIIEVLRDHTYHLDDTQHLQHFSKKFNTPIEDLRRPSGEPIFCKLTHPQSGCIKSWFGFWLNGFRKSAALYGPVHSFYGLWILISKLIKKPTLSELISALKTIIPRTILNIIWSVIFLAGYRVGAWTGVCLMTNLNLRPSPMLLRLYLCVAGIPVLFEYKSRRYELAMYCLPRALESLYKNMVKTGYAPSISKGELLIFMIGSACMMHTYQNHPDKMKSTFVTAFNHLGANINNFFGNFMEKC